MKCAFLITQNTYKKVIKLNTEIIVKESKCLQAEIEKSL